MIWVLHQNLKELARVKDALMDKIHSRDRRSLEKKEKLSDDNNHGYSYISTDNKNMVEFCVDNSCLLYEYALSVGFGSFGGN
jgi:hypothetical protein